MATLIRASGETLDVAPAHGSTFTLQELQRFVGGYIEVLRGGSQLFVLNERGKLEGAAYNLLATHRAHDFLDLGDCLVGDVLVCDETELD